MICGDTHANLTFATQVTHLAAEHGCKSIIQVGDFGYWPRTPAGVRYLDTLGRIAAEADIRWYFVDGNHEDHEVLGTLRTGPHPHAISSHIIWMPRGTVETFDDRRILFFGGAPSVDTAYRTPGYDWFPEEVASPAEWEQAASAVDIDIVVAHDVPTGTALTLAVDTWPKERVHASAQHRAQMLTLAEILTPRLWLAGHYHQRTSSRVNGTVVQVLDCDGGPIHHAVGILDTDTCALDELPVRTVPTRQPRSSVSS